MKNSFDEKLKQILFYQIHESYLPFIGDSYNKYKILQVGESHYINQKKGGVKYDTKYFHDNWWVNNCNQVLDDLDSKTRINTREIIRMFISNENISTKRGERIPYAMYQNILKVFNEVYELENNRENYNCFAFMNFFQIPSLVYGEGIYNSLKTCDDNWKQNGEKVWEKVCEQSTKVFSRVVDIIEPKLIIFTSKLAYSVYEREKLDFGKDVIIKSLVHPGCSWWNRLNGEHGRGKFRDTLMDYKNTHSK